MAIAESSLPVQYANWQEEQQLKKKLSVINSDEKQKLREIYTEQRMVIRRFHSKVCHKQGHQWVIHCDCIQAEENYCLHIFFLCHSSYLKKYPTQKSASRDFYFCSVLCNSLEATNLGHRLGQNNILLL